MQMNRSAGDARTMETMLRATMAIAVLLLAGNGVRAQIDNGLPGPQPFDIGGFVMNQMLLENALYNGRRSANNTKATGKAGKSAATKGVTTYQATPGVSAKVR